MFIMKERYTAAAAAGIIIIYYRKENLPQYDIYEKNYIKSFFFIVEICYYYFLCAQELVLCLCRKECIFKFIYTLIKKIKI